jgi:hypothetical protein
MLPDLLLGKQHLALVMNLLLHLYCQQQYSVLEDFLPVLVQMGIC